MNSSVTKHSLTMVLKVGMIGLSVRSRRKLGPSIKMKIRSLTTQNLSPTTILLIERCNGRINFG